MSRTIFVVAVFLCASQISGLGQTEAEISPLNRILSTFNQRLQIYTRVLEIAGSDSRSLQEVITANLFGEVELIQRIVDKELLLFSARSQKFDVDPMILAKAESRMMSKLTEIYFAVDGVHIDLKDNSTLSERLEVIRKGVIELNELETQLQEFKITNSQTEINVLDEK